VNNQQVRNRFWDGQDNMVRDDLSMLHGNHLFQLGGIYQHNFNWHQRTDNGGTIDNLPVYDLGLGASGSSLSADLPVCSVQTVAGTGDISNCPALTAAVLGVVSASEVVYTRSGPSLTLQPLGTAAQARSTIPYYNVYFSDTWHMKPTFTLTYGLGYALEMPPTEATGSQVELVDQADEPIGAAGYLASRRRAALQGQVYNPEIGFALVGNTENGLKYPYNPYYGEFSPRVAAAWSPHFDADSFSGKIFGHEDTVIRGGYGRQYGRLNGVDLVLVPLLAPGILQATQCVTNYMPIPPATAGTCGSSSPSASTAFRIGPDGLNINPPAGLTNLPQPYYPGYNMVASGPGESLDPNFRPTVIDSFDLTFQRQLSRRVSLEVGYIGRKITHEYQPTNINAVPYMMTVGGQQFSQAYKNALLEYCGGVTGMGGGGCAQNLAAVTPQAFFEKALTNSFCTTPVQVGTKMVTPTSCTNAVMLNYGGLFPIAYVWSLWSALDNGAFNFPHTMMNTPIASTCNAANNFYGCTGQTASGVAINASLGHGSYNGGFASLKMADWKGLTMQSNFTWSKALGTGAVVQASSEYTENDPFDLNNMYGRQPFDRKITYNAFLVYQPPFFKGQSGFMGRVLGGWTFASVFTAGSGTPIEVYTTTGDGQEFGAGDNLNYFGNESAVPIGPIGAQGHAYYNSPSDELPVNIFKNGVAEASNWRNPILGLDTRDGGAGILSGLSFWNMDFSIKKNIRVAESVSFEVQGVFANVLNHNQWLDPTGIGLYNPAGFGALGGGEASPRNIELGARVRF